MDIQFNTVDDMIINAKITSMSFQYIRKRVIISNFSPSIKEERSTTTTRRGKNVQKVQSEAYVA